MKPWGIFIMNLIGGKEIFLSKQETSVQSRLELNGDAAGTLRDR
jgi:hypothetical protein